MAALTSTCARRRRRAKGASRFTLDDAGVRFHHEHVVGSFAIDARLRQGAPGADAIALDGTRITMSGVRVTGSSADTRGWSGQLVVQDGDANARTKRVDASVTLAASSARPVLALVLGDHLPGFVVDMIDMPELSAATHVRIEPNLLVLDDASASGTNFALHGVYVVRNDERSGAFVAHKGALSAGIGVDGDSTHVRLFGLDRWYAERARDAIAVACGSERLANARCDLTAR